MKTLKRLVFTLFVMASALTIASGQETLDLPKLDAPYVPTRQEVVKGMLEMASVTENDVLYDLGCGDGRIVITAARDFGAKGTGVDIDPKRIGEANENARQAGVADKVKFMQGNLFEMDFRDATVVTLYLLPDINMKLRPILLEQLKPGTRIVSHAFDMGDWEPEKTITVEGSTLYFWTIPNKE
ncbi:MAG: class I SAM-dependent methyltransferase [Bacteroidetes bacterium]|nr:class I SAM-dependent methyltransferase [Bacteroidota bacterium]